MSTAKPCGARKKVPATETVVCRYRINGPSVGRNVVAWIKYCKVRVTVPADAPPLERRCRHHSSSAVLAKRAEKLGRT